MRNAQGTAAHEKRVNGTAAAAAAAPDAAVHQQLIHRPSIFALLTALLWPTSIAGSGAASHTSHSHQQLGRPSARRPNRFIIAATVIIAVSLVTATQLYRHVLYSSASSRASDALANFADLYSGTGSAAAAPADHVNISSVLNHIKSIQQIASSDVGFETTRSRAREYVRDRLVGEFGFDADRQILWNRFELQQQKAEGWNVVTTTWSGINIMVWTNSTPVAGAKVRIVGAHYDTALWGRQQAENATSEHPSLYGTYDNLVGAATVVELAGATLRFLRAAGLQDTVPFLFVLFDHNKPPPHCIGSKSLLDLYNWTEDDVAYAIVVDSIGMRSSRPVVQTIGYEHDGHTTFTPAWLARLLLSAASAADQQPPPAPHQQQQPDARLRIGHPSAGNSLLYQMSRYHLVSSRYINDDGPFAWRDIPATLYTNNIDYIFLDHMVPERAQLPLDVLDRELLRRSARQLMHIVAMSTDENLSTQLGMSLPHAHLHAQSANEDDQPAFEDTDDTANARFKADRQDTASKIFHSVAVRPFISFVALLRRALVGSLAQYIVLPPVQLGFLELITLSTAAVVLSYQVTFKKMRRMVLHNTQFRHNVIRSHRIVALHMALMYVAVWMDPAFATVLLLMGTVSMLLVPVTKFYIGVMASFVVRVGCLQVTFFDVLKIRKFGVRLSTTKEFELGCLVTIYISHSLFILLYSFDYVLKEIHLLRHRRALRRRSHKQTM